MSKNGGLTQRQKNRIWREALKALDRVEFAEAVTVETQGWPAAAYAALCAQALRDAAGKAWQPR